MRQLIRACSYKTIKLFYINKKNETEKQLQYCAKDVVYLHKIYEGLHKILHRENRLNLYNNSIKFLRTRVDLDLASFKDDIWSH